MKRIILHWTAGAYGMNHIEADAYHFIINRDGTVSQGIDRVEDNIPPLRTGAYAAHTRALNSHSIGIAVDAMADARERPFDPGKYPITDKQVAGMVGLAARMAMKYDIPVTRETILTHAEVQPTLGVWQRFKWDITWLPGMKVPGDPVEVGDVLREKIAAAIGFREKRERDDVSPPLDHVPVTLPAPPEPWWKRGLRRFGR